MLTININGITLCHKGSEGVSHNTLPDVCKTPPFAIPIPYENEAYSADLVKGTVSVSADGGNMIANMGSQFARSVFDEPGSMGGVISGTNRAETEWISHSFDVFFEKKPACRLTDKLLMNHGNTVNMAGLMQAPLPPVPELPDNSSASSGSEDGKQSAPPPAPQSDENAPTPPSSDKNDSTPPPTDDDPPQAMPCIVILVHGVNDVGEAYQTQDEGICAGLNERLGRKDIQHHRWDADKFMITDVGGNVALSPVIPFYWGYKPVDHEVFKQDQLRYKDELKPEKKGNEADLAYDTYREDDTDNIAVHNNENIDNLYNWLDSVSSKGGGTFANATTNIPDMFGPGAAGVILAMIAKLMSRTEVFNSHDWSHPIYQNPHRIYQAYAARRLADLILDIRRNPDTEKDTINIVAHSQGTIITMLANMWVEAEGVPPADCAILNHSPYALENRWLENAMPGNQQTSEARKKTFAHFCQLMAKNPLAPQGSLSHDTAYIQNITDTGCLPQQAQLTLWKNPLYNRNNFGRVYNYFCPNDQVVSMSPIQGFGWRGIPDEIKAQLGNNLYQRAFCKDIRIGDRTGFHYVMPAHKPDDSKNTGYDFTDVTINAPLLPAPFTFKLMGQGTGYKAELSGNDPKIAKAAMKAERFISETIHVPDSPRFYLLADGSALDQAQLNELNIQYSPWEIVKGNVSGNRDSFQLLIVWRRMTEAELNKVITDNPSEYSQHSSIVTNKEVSTKATVYDMAIGQNKSFENKDFWNRLLLQADWRRPDNPIEGVKTYYQEGILPFGRIKQFMNKPERPNGMPLGHFGVVNDYGSRQKVIPGNKRDTENQTAGILQWDMPKPQV
ncbi:DUF4150 domain-containing protein [Buttiauxella selenatireducens]|uniref:DUF4150 domain-containing protein n=1 Tax=Buttiauxella selenatireducens TaxID=3073902 RepID=A0ABY9SD47_9ENTR|nr:PAAR-like domain-containing protein [Buttiauxella sp. R73]WMY74047.1 DUF4150 domain-containing protein [Buttiauxella sp. R73]